MATLFFNCRILRDHVLQKDELWVADGKIIDPTAVGHKTMASIDCMGRVITPGFIDFKLNGAFGVDFSDFGVCDDETLADEVARGIGKVCSSLPSRGVTAFCPTIVTSSNEVYRRILPHIKGTMANESKGGAVVLGAHLDGPFLNPERQGAHQAELTQKLESGFETVVNTYGSLENVCVVTLAPEVANGTDAVSKLREHGVVVSLGHTSADLVEAEATIHEGASAISHLFNAMTGFHHRDPGVLGLLASNDLPANQTVFFGIIADGVHTHPAALRMAQRISPEGLMLISDGIAPIGLAPGRYMFGGRQVTVDKNPKRAYVSDTEILCGSVSMLDSCVRYFQKSTECSVEAALEAASLHPAQCLGLTPKKGTLDFGADADFVLLDEELQVVATYIGGFQVYSRNV